ncbi:MAG TPA: DUF4383 domain-containing protein [Trueperaceae bacterium]
MTRDIQRLATLLISAILTVLGLVGFFSGTQLFGLGSDALHNSLYLLAGIIGLAADWQDRSNTYNRAAGAFFLLVAVLGFVAAGLGGTTLEVTSADNVFHLVLGAVLAAIGFAPKTLGRWRTTA